MITLNKDLHKLTLLYYQGVLLSVAVSVISIAGKGTPFGQLSLINSGLAVVILIYSVIIIRRLSAQKIPHKTLYIVPVIIIIGFIFAFVLGFYIEGLAQNGMRLPTQTISILTALKYVNYLIMAIETICAILVLRKLRTE